MQIYAGRIKVHLGIFIYVINSDNWTLKPHLSLFKGDQGSIYRMKV